MFWNNSLIIIILIIFQSPFHLFLFFPGKGGWCSVFVSMWYQVIPGLLLQVQSSFQFILISWLGPLMVWGPRAVAFFARLVIFCIFALEGKMSGGPQWLIHWGPQISTEWESMSVNLSETEVLRRGNLVPMIRIGLLGPWIHRGYDMLLCRNKVFIGWFDSQEEEEEEASSDAERLMKVWLMVLTEMPYSSTSALRQSKKAWTACLEAASGKSKTPECLYKISRQSIKQLLWDFSLDQSGGPTCMQLKMWSSFLTATRPFVSFI